MILNDLIKAKDVLTKIDSMDLPIRSSHKISKLTGNVQIELDTFEQLRNKLVTKYGEEVEGKITVTPDNQEDFFKEFEELLSIEIELTEKLIDIEDIDGIVLPPKEARLIDKFIKPY